MPGSSGARSSATRAARQVRGQLERAAAEIGVGLEAQEHAVGVVAEPDGHVARADARRAAARCPRCGARRRRCGWRRARSSSRSSRTLSPRCTVERHAPQRVAVEDVEVEPVARRRAAARAARRSRSADRARCAAADGAPLCCFSRRPEVDVGDARRRRSTTLMRRSRTPRSVSATLTGNSVAGVDDELVVVVDARQQLARTRSSRPAPCTAMHATAVLRHRRGRSTCARARPRSAPSENVKVNASPGRAPGCSASAGHRREQHAASTASARAGA